LVGGACDDSADQNDPALRTYAADLACPPLPAGVSGSPSTIADAIGLANALFAARPQALSIDCVLERLDRPMTVLGVRSVFSLQPAIGERSPRIFIFSGGGRLVMSVVPEGSGSPFLELAEYTSPLRSIKAQMVFPMTAPLSPTFPYDSILVSSGTICGACHTNEVPAPQVTDTQAFESDIFQPFPAQLVPLPYLTDQASSCDPREEPDRCAMLHALFASGNLTGGGFPSNAAYF
jgi:hypothetical protein